MKIQLFARYIRLIKQGITDYRWFLYYIQRIDYNPNHRKFISWLISYFLPKNSTLNNNIEIQKFIQDMKDDGLAVFENFVKKTQVEEIRAYLSTRLCFDPYNLEKGGIKSPESAHSSCVHAYYEPEDIVRTPHLFELANNSIILKIIENIIGAKPTISLIQIWWLLYGFDVEETSNLAYIKNSGEFHRDIDDWSEIKLFIYLTDVDEDSGPHAFIKKSHMWLLPPRQRVLDIYNPDFPSIDNRIILNGKAGFAWLENTYGLHQATIPKNKHRLVLVVTYTLFPLPYAPKIPLLTCLEPNQFDSYINRVYLKSR